MACARATCPDATASASPRPRRTATRATRALRWRIEPAEVVEHEPTLFRRESLQLVPRGVAEPRARARRSRLERGGNVHAVARRGPALTFLVLVRLVVGEGAAGVEQPVVQALLTLDRPLVESPGLELAGELSGLLRQRAGGGADSLCLHSFELLGERALPRRHSAELLQNRLPGSHQGQETLRLTVEPLLVAGQTRQPLDRFGESGPRLRPAHLLAALGEPHRDRVEGVERIVGERGGGGRVRIGFLELAARGGHLALGVAERRVELWRDERVLACRFANRPCHHVGSFLHRRLLRAGRGTGLAATQRIGHLLLTSGHGRRLEQRAVERRERLATPRLRQRIELPPELIRHARQLTLGFRARLASGRRLPPVR